MRKIRDLAYFLESLFMVISIVVTTLVASGRSR
jgi:hypothetical protein